MSDLPSFIPVIRPMQPILTYGEELSSSDIAQLQNQINTLSYRPTIIVLPPHYHVKDGDAFIAELAKNWSLGPHMMFIVYSPADKNVWTSCGSFYANGGGDPNFFKHDFSQRMSMDSHGGNLYSTLNSCLQDINVIANKAQATPNVISGRHTQQSQTTTHRGHGHAGHIAATPGSQIFPAVFAALVILVLIGRAMGTPPPRKRYDDGAGKVDALSSDVDRILRVMNNSQSAGTASSGTARPQNSQIPMSEFKKRAARQDSTDGLSTAKMKSSASTSLPVTSGTASRGAVRRDGDSAANLQSAIDTSAAKVRQDHKSKIAYEATYAPQTSSTPEEHSGPAPVVQDGAFIDSYVATFDTEIAKMKPQPTPVSQVLASAGADGRALMAMSQDAEPSRALQVFKAAQVSQLNKSSQASASPVAIDAGVAVSTPDIAVTTSATSLVRASSIPGASSAPAPTSVPASSFDLSQFTLEAAAAPFADILSSMGAPLGDMKTNAGSALPLGSMDSFGVVTSKDATQTVNPCPKCSELKMKDFSFCLKCGHNF